jgi:putative membrane protein
MTKQSEEPVVRLDVAILLAYDRTRLACERTMLAWVRTATALISFGFSIYSFFQFQLRGADQHEHLLSPREVGLFMITCGLASLLAGTAQHMLSMRQIRARWPEAPRSMATALAGMMALLGFTMLITALVRR